MAKDDALFSLIQSLSRSEKRYFRLFTDRDRNYNNYLKLFDAMEAQSSYDQDEIKEKFKAETFVKQLHVTKAYLRKLIYKSSRSFYSKESTTVEVRNYLINVEFLYSKELYAHCTKELKKAEKLALKFELFNYQMEILDWNRKLEQQVNPHNYEAFKSILNRQKSVLEKMHNQNAYLQVIVDVSSSMGSNSQKAVNNEGLLIDADNALSMEAKVMHYNARYFRNIQKDEPAAAEKDLKKLIQYFEENPKWISSKPGTYISSINNFITYYIYNLQFEDAFQLLNKAKEVYDSIRPNSENKSLLKQIMRTYNIELEIYREQHLYEDDPGHIEKTALFVDRNRHKMPKEYLISFWFQLANIRFMQKKFSQALKWTNNILQTNFHEVRLDIQIQARFLNMLIHLEQKNMFVLRYLVDNTRRFIKKRKPVGQYESVLLSFFSKMGKTPEYEFKAVYQGLYGNLFSNDSEEISTDQMDYVDYKRWLSEKC
jgi:hypothetical protein